VLKSDKLPRRRSNFLLSQALEWAGSTAGADADIISLSFGLDDSARPKLKPVLEQLNDRGKLVFAAASNSGGDGRRTYPAKELGVFAIHATKVGGLSPENLNPPRDGAPDNFGTLGWRIPSRWDRKDVYITGTSFATPIAAAIAANLLSFVRRAPASRQPLYFFGYTGMRRLLKRLSSEVDKHEYIRPWKDGMFNAEQSSIEEMQEMLRLMTLYDDKE